MTGPRAAEGNQGMGHPATSILGEQAQAKRKQVAADVRIGSKKRKTKKSKTGRGYRRRSESINETRSASRDISENDEESDDEDDPNALENRRKAIELSDSEKWPQFDTKIPLRSFIFMSNSDVAKIIK